MNTKVRVLKRPGSNDGSKKSTQAKAIETRSRGFCAFEPSSSTRASLFNSCFSFFFLRKRVKDLGRKIVFNYESVFFLFLSKGKIKKSRRAFLFTEKRIVFQQRDIFLFRQSQIVADGVLVLVALFIHSFKCCCARCGARPPFRSRIARRRGDAGTRTWPPVLT